MLGVSPPTLLPLLSSLQRCPMQPRHCRASGLGPPNSPKRRLDVRLSVCWGPWVCRGSHGAVVPSPKPVSSFCTCTQCVCRHDVLDEVPEGVRGCAESSRGRRLLGAIDPGQPRAQTAELLLLSTCSAILLGGIYPDLTQQNPRPKVLPSAFFKLNRRARVFNYDYAAPCVSNPLWL